MKKRIFSLFTALALFLSLLPGTAWAEETGAVTITKANGSSPVTMEAGKKYKTWSGQFGGGIEEVADQENPGDIYLVYADGVLTAHGNDYSGYPCIFGTVSIASDLTIKIERDQTVEGEQNAKVRLAGYAGPALVLNGHTLTLSDGVRLEAQNQIYSGMQESKDSCVIEGGTIVGQGNVEIQITDYTTAAAVQGLTIKDVPDVQITGSTATGGVVEHLTLVNCGAEILQRESSNTTIAEEGQITTDRLVSLGTLKRQETPPFSDEITQTGLMTTDGKLWAKGTDITSGKTQGIASNTPTAYKAGTGWVFYEPPAEGDAAKVTLDNAQCPKGGIAVGGVSAVSVEVKGENRIGSITAEGSVTVTKTNGTLNALVCGTSSEKDDYTVYGEAELGDPISLGPIAFGDEGASGRKTSSLTVTKGAKLTIPKMTAPGGGEGVGLIIFDLGEAYLRNEGTIVNNGTVALTGAAAESANAQTVKSLKLTGDTGKVMVEKTVEGSKVMETYTNGGVKKLEAAGTLDLSSAKPTETENAETWAKYGYKWEVLATNSGSDTITKAQLTLKEGFNATEVTLPGDGTDVTVKTEGDSLIGELKAKEKNGYSVLIHLTFSGPGLLKIQRHVEITGGDTNSLTVSAGAQVEVTGGFTVSAESINGTVTVNGTLKADGGDGIAILTGKVTIGSTGQLTVSGTAGVRANGTSGASGNFQNAFVIQRGGRFDANCAEYNIIINAEGRPLPGDLGSVIKLPDGYLPSGYRLDKSEGNSSNIASITNDPAGLRYESGTLKGALNGKFALHETHQWLSGWLNDSTNHWKTCSYDGCKQMQGPYPHTYDGDWDAECNTCGYRRSTSHTHSFGDDWHWDAGQHWKQCVCGERTETGAHVFDDDQDLVCDTCGYDRSADHTHSWAEDWTTSETHHWHECAAPGCPVTADSEKDGYGEHVYDNSRDTDCNTCGYERTVAPSRPSGGGGGVSTYAVTVEPSTRGGVSSSHARARGGATVTLTVTPDEGYRLNTLTVTDSQDNEIELTARDGGTYTFTMPARAVTVQAAFAAEWNSPYPDVPEGAPYWEAVRYVTENGLMSGYGSGLFGPDNSLTRAQFAQILHNREGRPAVNYLTRFEDVSDGAWYAQAVRWAAAQGIVSGYGDGRFGPDDPVTREQLALMLWRYAGSPAAGQELPFPDADEASGYALDALRWAAENGIISSSGSGRLEPRSNATRAQAAEMLMNFLKKRS